MNLRKPFRRLIVLTLLLPALLTGNPTPMRAASATPDAPRVAQKTLDRTGANLIQAEPALPDQSTIYVAHDATGANNGDSWSDAYTDLQDALDAATTTGGDEIWVAEGVYTPTAGITRTATFTLVNDVALYGGFAGTETTRDQRDWEAHVTVLSGDLDGNDTTDANGVVTNTSNITGSNAYHVVTGGGVTETAIFDGFTVTGGKNNVLCGGGMYNVHSSPTLTNVTFSGNYAGDGGGMCNEDNSHPALTNVTFSDNTAGRGGGMYNDSSSPVLASVTFSNNTGNGGGGGMYNTDDSHPALTYVTFSDNTTLGFGGGVCNFGSSPVLINVVFSGNGANFMAGGMYNANSSPTLTNVIFSGNHASTLGGSLGGGMYNANSNLTLTNATFSGNSTNSGGKGGGMYNSGSSLTLINATFSDNRTGSGGNGGGMYNSGASNALLTNCILWGNSDGTGTGETAQITNDNSAITVTYSLIQSATVYTGTGNLNADPQFVGSGSLRLRDVSPAIDAGDNSAITVTFDLDGNPRRVDVPDVPDTGNGIAPIVDMGAYEASFHKIYLPVVLLKHG